MANLIRGYDWQSSPLGRVETWPAELLSAVNLVLAWPNPTTLYWGPQLCLIYNDGYKQFLSGKHPDSLGAPAAQVWQEMWPAIQPDFDQVYRAGLPAVQHDILLPSEQGGVLRDEWWTYTLTPLFQGSTIAGILNLAENRTAAVLAQRDLAASDAAKAIVSRDLAASQQRLRIALRTANLGLWSLDLITMHMEGSTAFKAAFGRKPDELLSYDELIRSIHPADLPALQADVARAMQTGTSYRNEYRVFWPDGTEHWVLASGIMIAATDSTPPMRVGVVLDVTERHQTMAALIQTEKLAAVGRLASSIAHEINNPLEAVTNLLFLARSEADQTGIVEYLNLAERELQRVAAITNQTLRFHKQSSNPTACSCLDLISSAMQVFEGKLVNSSITTEKRKRANQPVVCFEGEIRQVLNNLIGNAIDSMHGRGGRLLLRSREATNWATGAKGIALTVADTGTGMSPETLRRLFEAFYTTKGIGGTGLGLWISSEIVRNHRGKLSVRSSRSPRHHGSVFTLFLPFHAPDRRPHSTPDTLTA